ncbi:MAG: hypothetical protein IPO16_07405 [Saprospiraceae bacterium]|nr:hypothetical protein [Saprospiraceae bacterium]
MKLLTFLLLLYSLECFCQIDTTRISLMIKGLHTIEDHKRFWKEIYHKDQHYRGKLANHANDQENLIAISYYFNTFGYHDTKKLGRESAIILAVKGHNRSEIHKLTFPIVLESFKAKVMDEKSFQQYWQGVYKQEFNNDDYKNKSLPMIFNLLGLNVSKKINIHELLSIINDYNNFMNAPKEIIGQWISPEGKKLTL